ncbi:unnamed protein product [Arabis nemorensis]|uniref:Uncharacterized protein n=1 Tax=Arabis nemorensis TaxID=586526 RepID=A0A565B4Y6_9BRAS|nr:unnamed protein product [Arabis nemorensis]
MFVLVDSTPVFQLARKEAIIKEAGVGHFQVGTPVNDILVEGTDIVITASVATVIAVRAANPDIYIVGIAPEARLDEFKAAGATECVREFLDVGESCSSEDSEDPSPVTVFGIRKGEAGADFVAESTSLKFQWPPFVDGVCHSGDPSSGDNKVTVFHDRSCQGCRKGPSTA